MTLDADLALAWLSVREAGRLDELLRTISWLTGRRGVPRNWVWDLHSMGIVTVDFAGGLWRSEPTLVTRLPGRHNVALLTGSRPADIESQAKAVVPRLVDSQPDRAGSFLPLPRVLWLQFDEERQLEKVATAVGGRYVACEADRLSRTLRPVELGSQSVPPPRDAPLKRLDVRSGQFKRESWSPALPEGLYEVKLYSAMTRYLAHWQGEWFRTTRREGMHFYLPAEEWPLRWYPEDGNQDGDLGNLVSKKATRLPLQHDRVAALCTGLPVWHDTEYDQFIYYGVPREIASRIARSLHRKLKVAW